MTGGSQTSDPRFRELVAHTIDEVSDVIVEHRHYRGASAPTRRVFGSMADFDKYMHEHARPGDRFVIWRFDDARTDQNIALEAKTPDDQGRIPKHGVY